VISRVAQCSAFAALQLVVMAAMYVPWLDEALMLHHQLFHSIDVAAVVSGVFASIVQVCSRSSLSLSLKILDIETEK
jgi:branched-subunit amino acid transport protein